MLCMKTQTKILLQVFPTVLDITETSLREGSSDVKYESANNLETSVFSDKTALLKTNVLY